MKHPPPDALYSALGPEMAELIIEHIRASPSPSSAQPSTSQPSPSPGDGAGGEPTPLRPLQLGTPVAGQGTPMPPDVAAMGEELERARADLERTRRDAAALVGDVNRLRAENDVLRARLARAAREGHEGALDDGEGNVGVASCMTRTRGLGVCLECCSASSADKQCVMSVHLLWFCRGAGPRHPRGSDGRGGGFGSAGR